jgi:hypothetical protein
MGGLRFSDLQLPQSFGIEVDLQLAAQAAESFDSLLANPFRQGMIHRSGAGPRLGEAHQVIEYGVVYIDGGPQGVPPRAASFCITIICGLAAQN